MLHNKYHEILKLFLGNYKKEIYGRELIGKVTLGQKAIALALEDLEKQGILKSRKQGNIKLFSLNLDNKGIKDILITVERMEKINFLKKHKKLNEIFDNDSRIVGIFGSYAKKIQTKESDIDIFVIGKKKKKDYYEKGEVYDLDISVKYFTDNEFEKLIKEKNNLIKEIIENHILIFNIEKFVNLIWENYYGFN